MNDPYAVLGLPPGTDERTVNKVFRALARDLHPERYVGAPEEERAAAEARFKEVSAAFAAIKADREERRTWAPMVPGGSLVLVMGAMVFAVAIVLGGGGLVDAFYDHPMGGPLRALYAAMGGTREKLQQTIANADPITNARNLKGREVLMIGAKNDEIVPPSACERMWKELGEPKIVWYEAGHYTAIFYIHDALTHVVELLKK